MQKYIIHPCRAKFRTVICQISLEMSLMDKWTKRSSHFGDKLYTYPCRYYQMSDGKKWAVLNGNGNKGRGFLLWLEPTTNLESHLLVLTLIKAASCVDVQVDTNKDRLVSLSEFMAATKKEEFLEKEEWEVRAWFYRKVWQTQTEMWGFSWEDDVYQVVSRFSWPCCHVSAFYQY